MAGKPGHFSYQAVSFRYPRSWELVSSGGHHGLVGNSLWSAPIGVSEDDRVLIQAYYFPWKYSNRQLQRQAQRVVDSVVGIQDGRVLRPVSRVKTGGVTVFWSDFASTPPSGVDSLTRAYYFVWNDVEYYFACQEGLDSEAGIIRGCDRIFSTLRLGTEAS